MTNTILTLHDPEAARRYYAAGLWRADTLYTLLCEHAARRPADFALRDGTRRLTWSALLAMVDAVAADLDDAGLKRGERVAVWLPSRVESVAVLLACSRQGYVCNPSLHQNYTVAEIALLLARTRAAALFAQPGYGADAMTADIFAGVGELSSLRRVYSLGDGPANAAPFPAADNARPLPPVDANPDKIVYLAFTSGTTGTPKGVVVTHKNLATHVAASIADYALTAADRVLQFASPSFDISVEEIFCALAAGATLVVRPAALDIAGQDWLDWLATQRVTVADLPTAYWHEWVHDMRVRGANPPTSLRLVIVGGEKAQPAVYTEWLALAGDRARWVNTYGPTEATVVATSYFPRAERAREDAIEMPIGRPVRNVRAYVLDRHLRPVPIGVVGDLYIGGSGVAKGYLGQPALTDARFLPSPFVAGDRLYRTGDLARALPDGTLLFAGRADEQVKLRGYRVEPGEVERVLGQHPGIAECAVVARTDSSGAMSLAAYVVPVHGASLAVAEIQAHLHERLPAYMVPAAVGVLHALPTSANGKIDLASLPMIEAEAHETVAPRNRTEEMLAGIWKEVLGHEVGVHDNFFEAAGHSLLAVRMFALLEREIQRRFPLATIVASPTIAELGGLIDGENRSTDGYRCLVPLQPRGRRVPLYVIHEVTGDVIGYRQLIAGLGSDQPVFGFESPAIKNEPPLDYRVEEISATYVAELRRFQPDGPYRLLGSCFGGVVAYEMARQLRAAGADVDLVVLINAVPYGYGERPPSALWRLVRRPTPAAARQYVRFRMLRLRRRVHRTLWWLQASQYVLGRRPLPSGLLEPITLHHVATQAYVALPYAGDLVHIISDDREPAPHDRRLLWTELAARVDEIRLTGPQFARPYFLTSSNVAIAGERLRERLDAMAAGL